MDTILLNMGQVDRKVLHVKAFDIIEQFPVLFGFFLTLIHKQPVFIQIQRQHRCFVIALDAQGIFINFPEDLVHFHPFFTLSREQFNSFLKGSILIIIHLFNL